MNWKRAQFFKKCLKQSLSQKNVKAYSSKLILKVQNIYTKPLFKPQTKMPTTNYVLKPPILVKNVVHLLEQKVAQMAKIVQSAV